MNIREKLGAVQKTLKAPKSQYNSFGKYNYRSCEDILEAAKPLCVDNGLVLTISDEITLVGNRVYVKATATVADTESGEVISVSGMAREAEDKKGMDPAQLTGATSSYARKYALGGLFALDDTKDADATNDHKGKAMANKAEAAGIGEQVKEYKCCDCGKEFKEYTDKNGKTWTAGQVYHMSESNNTDGKARCSACMKKAGTQKQKG
jgi:DNA-directed RNA polymerase subunit RPC12/RpoP